MVKVEMFKILLLSNPNYFCKFISKFLIMIPSSVIYKVDTRSL